MLFYLEDLECPLELHREMYQMRLNLCLELISFLFYLTIRTFIFGTQNWDRRCFGSLPCWRGGGDGAVKPAESANPAQTS